MERLVRIVVVLGLLPLAFSATGCKKQQREDLNYYHPHKSFTRWAEDMDHCRYSVNALLSSDRLEQGSFDEGVASCMSAKGYVHGFRPFPTPPSVEELGILPPGAQFTLLDSTWHSTSMAQNRADYLERTGIWTTSVRSWDSGLDGVWQQVSIGSFDSLQAARRERDRLAHTHGLHDLKIILR